MTGGAGLIGSHLVEDLFSKGHDITILDDLSTGNQNNVLTAQHRSQIRFVIGSILSEREIYKLMSQVEVCFHLAASLGVKRILEKPRESLEINLRGTENVLLAAAHYKVPVFLASTSEVYGRNTNQPLNENSDRVLGSPLNIRWAYSEAKAIDETLAMMLKIESGLEFVIGRFFNVVGPRQVGTYGMVLPRFVQAALSNENLKVFGTGNQTRVFCHVLDAVDATTRLMFDDRFRSEIFNIGGIEEISILDLAKKVIQLTNSTSKIEFVDYKDAYPVGFEETNRRVPNTLKLSSNTGWRCRRSLDSIIIDVANWHQERMDSAR